MSKIRILSEEMENKRWPYFLILPMVLLFVLWIIIKKKINTLLNKEREVGLLIFDGIGRHGKVIKKNATGWKAVDLIYNHSFGEDKSFSGRLDDFWFGNLNCQAARNRFKLAKKELKKAILEFSNQSEVRITSLAAGTGQIESETVAEIKKRNIKVKATLIDKEHNALKRAQEFISLNNVQTDVEVMNSDAMHSIDMVKHFKPHIINMIAFLDYFPDKEAIEFVSKIYQALPVNGFFIASNSMPNVEMHFVKWVVGWPLIYRKSSEIASIVKKSGFTKYQIITEPLHIQSVVVARKVEELQKDKVK